MADHGTSEYGVWLCAVGLWQSRWFDSGPALKLQDHTALRALRSQRRPMTRRVAAALLLAAASATAAAALAPGDTVPSVLLDQVRRGPGTYFRVLLSGRRSSVIGQTAKLVRIYCATTLKEVAGSVKVLCRGWT